MSTEVYNKSTGRLKLFLFELSFRRKEFKKGKVLQLKQHSMEAMTLKTLAQKELIYE
jgi:hypothetical protein